MLLYLMLFVFEIETALLVKRISSILFFLFIHRSSQLKFPVIVIKQSILEISITHDSVITKIDLSSQCMTCAQIKRYCCNAIVVKTVHMSDSCRIQCTALAYGHFYLRELYAFTSSILWRQTAMEQRTSCLRFCLHVRIGYEDLRSKDLKLNYFTMLRHSACVLM